MNMKAVDLSTAYKNISTLNYSKMNAGYRRHHNTSRAHFDKCYGNFGCGLNRWV